MTISELGAIGEFVGAIGVIASVLYLALQIRHAWLANGGTAVQAVTSQFARMQFDMANNGELSALVRRAHAGEPLDDVERGRVGDLLSAYFIALENFHYQHKMGLMAPNAFEARERVIANLLSSQFARDWWSEQGRRIHPQDFVAEVDRVVGRATAQQS